jgi:hypothetical protein
VSCWQVNDWELLFSNSVHGNSLQTMTRLCAGKGATLVAVEDVDGNVFGAHTQARRAQSYLWRNCGPVVLAVCLASRHLMDCFGTLRWLCFHVLEDGSRVRRQLLQVRCAPTLLVPAPARVDEMSALTPPFSMSIATLPTATASASFGWQNLHRVPKRRAPASGRWHGMAGHGMRTR